MKGWNHDATWFIAEFVGRRNLVGFKGTLSGGAAGIVERCRGAAKKLEVAPRRRGKSAVAQRATQTIQRGVAQAIVAE